MTEEFEQPTLSLCELTKSELNLTRICIFCWKKWWGKLCEIFSSNRILCPVKSAHVRVGKKMCALLSVWQGENCREWLFIFRIFSLRNHEFVWKKNIKVCLILHFWQIPTCGKFSTRITSWIWLYFSKPDYLLLSSQSYFEACILHVYNVL